MSTELDKREYEPAIANASDYPDARINPTIPLYSGPMVLTDSSGESFEGDGDVILATASSPEIRWGMRTNFLIEVGDYGDSINLSRLQDNPSARVAVLNSNTSSMEGGNVSGKLSNGQAISCSAKRPDGKPASLEHVKFHVVNLPMYCARKVGQLSFVMDCFCRLV